MGRYHKIAFSFLVSSFIFLSSINFLWASNFHVGNGHEQKTIRHALSIAKKGDSVFVHPGVYKEGNIQIKEEILFIGLGWPVLDGEFKQEVVSIFASNVLFEGFVVQHSGFGTINDPCAIKVYNCNSVVINNNIIRDNFFGIYIQSSSNCTISKNIISSHGTAEQKIGNGIHCWKSDSLLIIANKINGHRDGLYFEFVTNSVVWRNISIKNIRYGIHFMFSNHDAYIGNVFRNNGAGVAVMFSNHVHMINNYFEENWGDASYGILLKEISDAFIFSNHFKGNTIALYLEGASRIKIEKNIFIENGWAMKIQASCMENTINGNNFIKNTFDAGTNGDLVLNTFEKNYWDKYEGYDLNKDMVGDIPYHPLSLFSVIIEKIPPAMLLFRSFMASMLDKSERMLPSLTPDSFKDSSPRMKPYLI